jgi:hypothetical protein
MVILPDFPDTWKALTDEERHVANRRLALDAAEADIDEPGGMTQLRGIKLAFMDPKTWVLAVAYHGITGAAGLVILLALTKRLIQIQARLTVVKQLPKLLPVPGKGYLQLPKQRHEPPPRRSAIRLHGHLVSPAFAR